jgi:hypothetical protein
MNEGVLNVVHAFLGDQWLVEQTLGTQLQFERPVLLLSPENMPAIIDHPQVKCAQAGRNGWQGKHVPFRQIEHWRLALAEDAEWFLLNDADSFVLDPQLPDFLFEEDDVLWSTPIGFECNWRGAAGGDHPWPNFQPPYFCHRNWLQSALDFVDAPTYGECVPTTCTGPEGRIVYTDVRFEGDEPFDWGRVMAPDGVYNSVILRSGLAARANPLGVMAWNLPELAAQGFTFMHPVKTPALLGECLSAYAGRGSVSMPVAL